MIERLRQKNTVAAELIIAGLALAGCNSQTGASEQKSGQSATSPQDAEQQIKEHAHSGINMAPFVVASGHDGTQLVRPFAETKGGDFGCDPATQKRMAEVATWYVIGLNGKLKAYAPPENPNIVTRDPLLEGVAPKDAKNWVSCVQFDNTDKYVNGVPQMGQFDQELLVVGQEREGDQHTLLDPVVK